MFCVASCARSGNASCGECYIFSVFSDRGAASGRSSEDPLRQHMRILLYSAKEVQSAGLIEYVRRDRYLSFCFDFFMAAPVFCILFFSYAREAVQE